MRMMSALRERDATTCERKGIIAGRSATSQKRGQAPQGHLQFGVSQDLLQRLQRATPHHEPGGEGVPQVMEVKVDEVGLLDRTQEGCADVPKVPDPPLPRAGTSGQDLVHGLTHWDLAPSAGFRDLK